MRHRATRGTATTAAVLSVLLLASCAAQDSSGTPSGDGETPSSTAPAPADLTGDPYTGWPDAITVLGHSGATGEGSAGEPGVEAKQNSWATGTNPEVNSVYLRILREHPAIEGHVSNFAQGGADLAMIVAQAEQAVTTDPPPELVLVQAVDGDITCLTGASDDTYLDGFEGLLTELLTLLSEELPRARIFLTNQDPAAPGYEAKNLTRQQRAQLGGEGDCAFFDPQGRVVPRELRRLQDSIRRYVDRLAEVCERFDRCYHDAGVFRAEPDPPPEWLSDDLNHLTVPGLAHRAEAAWVGLRRQGLVPAGQ